MANKRVVIADKDETENLQYEQIPCPKCGAKKVVSWMQQTRAADEPPTRFYKCMNCGYSWREYS
jgi:DNA-directed RNA polymerase subunit M